MTCTLWDTIHHWHHLQQSNGCLAALGSLLRLSELGSATAHFEKRLMLKENHYKPQWLLTTTLFLNIAKNASKLIWMIFILKIILYMIFILENSDFDFDFTSFLDRRFRFWFEIVLDMILPNTGNNECHSSSQLPMSLWLFPYSFPSTRIAQKLFPFPWVPLRIPIPMHISNSN